MKARWKLVRVKNQATGELWFFSHLYYIIYNQSHFNIFEKKIIKKRGYNYMTLFCMRGKKYLKK